MELEETDLNIVEEKDIPIVKKTTSLEFIENKEICIFDNELDYI